MPRWTYRSNRVRVPPLVLIPLKPKRAPSNLSAKLSHAFHSLRSNSPSANGRHARDWRPPGATDPTTLDVRRKLIGRGKSPRTINAAALSALFQAIFSSRRSVGNEETWEKNCSYVTNVLVNSFTCGKAENLIWNNGTTLINVTGIIKCNYIRK